MSSDRGYSRNKERDRNRDRDGYHGSEVKSHHHHHQNHSSNATSSSSSTSSSKDFEKRHSKDRDDHKRKKHKRSRSPHRNRDRRSSERDCRHRDKSPSRYPHRRYDDERSSRDYKNKDSGRRNQQRSRSHSRSASRERERAREKNKQEVKLQMQRNYEEQLEKMRNAAVAQPAVPFVPPVNQASRLVEQIQQRKLLFSKKPEETAKPPAVTLWKQPTFSDDTDGKVSAKFKRLMGMKDDTVATPTPSSTKESEVVKKQQQYFEDLEKQYEVARVTTHTNRGLGLGFGSSSSLR